MFYSFYTVNAYKIDAHAQDWHFRQLSIHAEKFFSLMATSTSILSPKDESNNSKAPSAPQQRSQRRPRKLVKPKPAQQVKELVISPATSNDSNAAQPRSQRSRLPKGHKITATPSASSGNDTSMIEYNLICPVCIEKFDDMELRFKPCPCGYRVCAMCIHLIKEKADGKCPNCRTEYSDARAALQDEIDGDLLKMLQQFRNKEAKELQMAKAHTLDLKRKAQGRQSMSKLNPGSKHAKDKSKPIKVSKSPPMVDLPPPSSEIKLTRFTGGISVWD